MGEFKKIADERRARADRAPRTPKNGKANGSAANGSNGSHDPSPALAEDARYVATKDIKEAVEGHEEDVLEALESAKLRVADILERPDLIRVKKGGQKSDAASLLNPPADNTDPGLARSYLAYRLGIDPEAVLMPVTKAVGWRALAYWDSDKKSVGDFPCAVFETVAADGGTHAHRIYTAASKSTIALRHSRSSPLAEISFSRSSMSKNPACPRIAQPPTPPTPTESHSGRNREVLGGVQLFGPYVLRKNYSSEVRRFGKVDTGRKQGCAVPERKGDGKRHRIHGVPRERKRARNGRVGAHLRERNCKNHLPAGGQHREAEDDGERDGARKLRLANLRGAVLRNEPRSKGGLSQISAAYILRSAKPNCGGIID